MVVRRINGRFQLIAGERRLRAADQSRLAEVPAQVREADDRQVAEIAIVENLQRKDLNALEKAASFQQYLSTVRLHARRTGGPIVARSLDHRQFNSPARASRAVQHAVASGAVSAGHARALLPLGDEWQQMNFCERIESEGLSVRAVEELVQESIEQHDEPQLSVVGADGQCCAPPRAIPQPQIAVLGTRTSCRPGHESAN